MKKLILLLAVLLAGSAAQACSEAESAAAVSPPAAQYEQMTAAEQTETEEISDGLPKLDIEKADLGGRDFTIMTADWSGYVPLEVTDVVVEELSGEIVNDAAYNRNLYMKESYNVNVVEASFPAYTDQISQLEKSEMAGDTAYDVVLLRGWGAQSMLTKGLFCELDSVDHINVDNPWWSRNSYDSLSIGGKHFMAVSDMSVNHMLAVWCVYFNKSMLKDYGLDDPYIMVSDQKWTYERVFAMAAAAPADLDGDGKMSCDDQFGISHSNDTTMGMYNSSGIVVAKTDDAGYPHFTFTDDASISKQTYILEHLYDTNVCYNHHASKMNKKSYDESYPFSQGHILFMFAGIHNISMLRDMETDFGMLPYPKFDDSQENYIPSTSGLFLQMTAVPRINSGTEEIGMLIEAYARYGCQYLRPAFYDTVLQRKVTRDEESVAMIDYIFGNLSYDIGNVLNLGDFSIDMISIVSSYKSDLVSYYAKKMEKAESKLESLMNAISETG